MSSVQRCELPGEALLRRYLDGDAYTDCYSIDVCKRVTHEQFVAAFYTTWVFKLERWILTYAVSKPSTDTHAALLAAGQRESFSAWNVEARATDQLLMCDVLGNTRSWFMVAHDQPSTGHTRLFFGSAVVAKRDLTSGVRSMNWKFRALLGFHTLYSHVLLAAASSRLDRLTVTRT